MMDRGVSRTPVSALGGTVPKNLLDPALTTPANMQKALLENSYKIFGQISRIISQKKGVQTPPFPPWVCH